MKWMPHIILLNNSFLSITTILSKIQRKPLETWVQVAAIASSSTPKRPWNNATAKAGGPELARDGDGSRRDAAVDPGSSIRVIAIAN